MNDPLTELFASHGVTVAAKEDGTPDIQSALAAAVVAVKAKDEQIASLARRAREADTFEAAHSLGLPAAVLSDYLGARELAKDSEGVWGVKQGDAVVSLQSSPVIAALKAPVSHEASAVVTERPAAPAAQSVQVQQAQTAIDSALQNFLKKRGIN